MLSSRDFVRTVNVRHRRWNRRLRLALLPAEDANQAGLFLASLYDCELLRPKTSTTRNFYDKDAGDEGVVAHELEHRCGS